MTDDFLQKLERRFGWLAIPGLTRVLVMLNALVFVLLLYNEAFFSALYFNPYLVASGQIWRVVTFLFVPETMEPVFLLLALYFLWIIGDGLEDAWGAFRLTFFYLLSAALSVGAAFLVGSSTSSMYINTALFLSFATLYPNFTVLLFFILPVSVKWLAWIAFGFVVYEFVFGGLPHRAAIIAAAIPYVLYFAPFFLARWRDAAEVHIRRAQFEDDSHHSDTLHLCAECGATELSHPDRSFRVGADDRELCEECLKRRDTSRAVEG